MADTFSCFKIIHVIESQEPSKSDRYLGHYLGTLTIRAHGNYGAVFIGIEDADIISVNNIDNVEVLKQLARLKPYVREDTRIILWSCFTGSETTMIQNLANVTGANVYALNSLTSDYIINYLNPFFKGHWVSVKPGGAITKSSG